MVRYVRRKGSQSNKGLAFAGLFHFRLALGKTWGPHHIVPSHRFTQAGAFRSSLVFFLSEDLFAAHSDLRNEYDHHQKRGTEKQCGADRARNEDKEISA
jgi:hypothetical protein